MSVEGVWKVEMMGPYGWEQTATAFLQNGRYLGASTDHYSIGTYSEDGNTLRAETRVAQYAKARALFGSTSTSFDVIMEATIEDADTIAGKARTADTGNKFDVMFCLTRLGNLT